MRCIPPPDATDGSDHRCQPRHRPGCAEQLLAKGYRLCLGLRNPAGIKGTLLDSERVLPVAYDAGHPEQAVELVDAASRWAGGVDSLIHCAGSCTARRCCLRRARKGSWRNCGGSM